MDERKLRVDVWVSAEHGSTLADDVRRGLGSKPRSIPPKHFYDGKGSELFDAICDTEEYYLTRTEQALLEKEVDTILEIAAPTALVELGSGAARKTRTILEAMLKRGPTLYVPFDVSEPMLRQSAEALLGDYPALTVHGIVGDYERHLRHMPGGERRMVAFLGSTIGNFEPASAVSFLSAVAKSLGENDTFLLGVDLVKSKEVLDAAYNDQRGLTAAFNRNVLAVINTQLGANFDLDSFEHEAFFSEERSQIEMYLRSTRAQTVRIEALDLEVSFDANERIRTEISRKFTRASIEAFFERAGLVMERWFAAPNDAFALALARRAD